MNLSPKTTCLERPYFYGQWGGLSRQVLLYREMQVLTARKCMIVQIAVVSNGSTSSLSSQDRLNDRYFMILPSA